MRAPKTFVVLSLLASLSVGLVLVTRASDLSDRVSNLMRQGRYDLARDILADREQRGEALDHDSRWLRALLDTDPDDFDRRVHQLLQDTASDDPRAMGWLSARAIEHFAQGRYQTAADLLSGPGEASLLRDPEAPLFLAMSLQALGRVTEAEAAYARIPEGHPSRAAAISLRAELAARSGNWRAATQLAQSVAEDPDYGAQARLVLAQGARASGDAEAAAKWMTRLRRDFPGAVEASWGGSQAATAPEVVHTGFRELDAPDPRRDYALQLGAFRDRSLALRFVRSLVERFDGQLDALRVEVDRAESPPWYRVVAGHYSTRPQAQRAVGGLDSTELSAMILGPERGPR